MAGQHRTVYHTVHDANGNPRANYTIHFQLTPGAYVPHASLPESVVSVTTNDVGYFEADLETGVSIRVLMYSSFVQQGSTLIFGDKNVLTIVVPHGTVPIDLPTVIALETQADPPPDLAAIASTHIGRRDNPHEVTQSQVGLGNADNTADVDKPVSTATAYALALKADDAHLTAHKQDTNNPHVVMASQLTDFDTEVSASPDVAANTVARHTHANKATLDAVTTARLAPTGGAWHQGLRQGQGNPEWVSLASPVPLAVASPAGSGDRNGPLTISPSASVEVREGAWWLCEGAVIKITNPTAVSELAPWTGVYASRSTSLPAPLPRNSSGATTGIKYTASSDRINAYSGIFVHYGSGGAVSTGVPITASAWLWIGAGWQGTAPYMQIANVGLAYPNDRVFLDLTKKGQWQRSIHTVTAVSATNPSMGMLSQTVYTGDTLYATDLQMELGPYPTPVSLTGARVDGTLTCIGWRHG